jgi:anti-sigma-K factor RskA
MNLPDEKMLCEYLFDLLSKEERRQVKFAIDKDFETREKLLLLKRKFDNLQVLNEHYQNPIKIFLRQLLLKRKSYFQVHLRANAKQSNLFQS